MEDILAQRESLAKELEALQNQAENIDALHTEISLTERQVREQAVDLSRRRRWARRLLQPLSVSSRP